MKRGTGAILAITMISLLAGCIQPTKTSETPTSGAAQVAAPPTGSIPSGSENLQPPAPGQSWPLVEQFIQGRGEVLNNLEVWYDQPRGTDQLQGFSYTNAGGLPCAGFLLTALINGVWQPNNGALLCAPQPTINALAGATYFSTTDGQPYTIIFGRVEDPTVTAIAVIYSDNSNQTVNPYMGGFLFLKLNVLDVNVITAINQEGNTVIDNIPLSPVS